MIIIRCICVRLAVAAAAHISHAPPQFTLPARQRRARASSSFTYESFVRRGGVFLQTASHMNNVACDLRRDSNGKAARRTFTPDMGGGRGRFRRRLTPRRTAPSEHPRRRASSISIMRMAGFLRTCAHMSYTLGQFVAKRPAADPATGTGETNVRSVHVCAHTHINADAPAPTQTQTTKSYNTRISQLEASATCMCVVMFLMCLSFMRASVWRVGSRRIYESLSRIRGFR